VRDANLTQVVLAARDDLERIAVNQLDDAVPRNKNQVRVDVANNVTVAMNGLKGSGHVPGCIDQKTPVFVGVALLPMARTVKMMDRL
jgi:hypothetical protein